MAAAAKSFSMSVVSNSAARRSTASQKSCTQTTGSISKALPRASPLVGDNVRTDVAYLRSSKTVGFPLGMGASHQTLAGGLSVRASIADPSREGESGEKAFNDAMRIPSSMASIGTQLGGGGSATLERQSLDLTQSVSESKAKTDDTGGGGNNGKNLNNGGGGDGGDDGDDDDYFDDDDGDEGDDGVFTKRSMLPELFDRATINAVLQEWYKTLYSLPSGLRMAVEMGLVSSAQLVRFLSVDARPSIIRAVARKTPASFSRGFVGRMMGDPSILVKLAYEQTLTAGLTLFYEAQQRGKKFGQELDLVAVNVLGAMATNAAMVWMLCPNRVFGAPNKFAWERTLNSLPSNCFDRSGPLREYTNMSRGIGFFVKAAELSAVGVGVGAISGAVGDLLVNMRRKKDPSYQPALANPGLSTSAAGYGAYAGLTGNIRYQLINGLDRYMLQTFSSLPLSLGTSALVRFGGLELGEITRLHWLGLPKEAPKKERVRTVAVKKTVRRVKKVPTSSKAAATSTAAASAPVAPVAPPAEGFSVSASVGKRTHH